MPVTRTRETAVLTDTRSAPQPAVDGVASQLREDYPAADFRLQFNPGRIEVLNAKNRVVAVALIGDTKPATEPFRDIPDVRWFDTQRRLCSRQNYRELPGVDVELLKMRVHSAELLAETRQKR